MWETDENFISEITTWFEKNKRNLPWRDTKNAYFIWLSEIILQQTRVAQGLPYFEKFTEYYPNIAQLAAASEDEIMRLWQGLGYYSRARNMHKTAKIIAEKGFFPNNFKDLKKLPGIGDYTAAAVASFAFGEAVAVLDGNVFRVLSRYFGIENDISSPEGKKFFAQIAQIQLDKKRPDLYNQAIMEFGALHCKPSVPLCDSCPIRLKCFAFAEKKQEFLPVKAKKIAVKERFLHYFLVEHDGKFLLKKRAKDGIWEGLYDLPFREENEEKNIAFLLQNFSDAEKYFYTFRKIGEILHILTHQKLRIFYFYIGLKNLEKPEEWAKYDFFTLDEIEKLPKPIVLANFFKKKTDFF
jgi:A/G-specific adenine glycosylase